MTWIRFKIACGLSWIGSFFIAQAISLGAGIGTLEYFIDRFEDFMDTLTDEDYQSWLEDEYLDDDCDEDGCEV